MAHTRDTATFESRHQVRRIPSGMPLVPDFPGQIPLSDWPVERTWRDVVRLACPQDGLPDEVNSWRARNGLRVLRSFAKLQLVRRLGVPCFYTALYLDVVRADGEHVPYGLASLDRVVTSGADYVVDCWQNLQELETIHFHGIGTGTTAPADGDTDLGTASTTALAVANTRANGTIVEASHNVVRTVGTNTANGSSSIACTEAGLFTFSDMTQSISGAAGRILFDRFTFSVVNLAANDGIQTTADITVQTG